MTTETTSAPREALADILHRIAQHARKFEVSSVIVERDGGAYRVTVTGEGNAISPVGEDTDDDDLTQVQERLPR